MSTISIYEKYGGFDFFHKIIYDLYLELFDHPEISYHFLGVDILKLSKLQAEYLCEAIGGPKMYQGREIAGVHKYLRITDYEFETVAKRFGEIFANHGLKKEEVDFIMMFVGSKKPQIVTAKNSTIDRVMRFYYQQFFQLRTFFSKIFKKLK